MSTDKVDTEIPAPTSGVLTKIIAQEDDVVEVGGDLALIGDADEADSGSDDSGSESAGGDEPNRGRLEPEPEQAAEEPSTEEDARREAHGRQRFRLGRGHRCAHARAR